MRCERDAPSGATGAHPDHVLMPDMGSAGRSMQRQQEALLGSIGAHPDRVLMPDVESAGRSIHMQC